MSRRSGEIQCRVRLKSGDDIALGPGKVQLLRAIGETGSISAAARSMNMSYRRAWMLVETMNRSFRTPLVSTTTGGRSGGGAAVTAEGEKALQAYEAMMKEVDSVAERHLRRLVRGLPLVDSRSDD
ncbi:MAG: winged helix-turn-helix domain-containing protein [Pseudomonadota bacterium]